ncbi:molybdopterin-dependent oxidoreductase [Mesorhizobium neociceri]|uniref:Molybdopterin-dependent oxidoreductase n=1 Tax=Mesorhizobium neociceri TaxID=1307853 RepID=A0A838BGT8_9HYPH|nr:molybdopterin-dependent oxidoreductase [Mesorhizobium neociceri]MBA1144704.1 molybdopterin-dependent oxidoreductase [Mesorhizobium neociceri]
MRTEKPGFCALCKSRCGATFIVEDGRLTGAAPAPAHPTGKSLCVKGKAAPEILYHPDRLMTPLKRTNPKGSDEPGWVPVSWEQALSEIGERLRKLRDSHGIESVAVSTTTPSGTALSDGEEWIERLIQVSGTPNWVSTTEICNWHKDFAHAFTFGTGLPYPDYGQAELIVLWGFNPSSVWLDQATQVAAARARGCKILVIDPRRFGFAIGADQWLRVRPGSDGILALGIMRLLIEENSFDDSFLMRWTNAAFLVRDDNGEFLRGGDLNAQGEDTDAFVVLGTDGRLTFVQGKGRETPTVLAQAARSGEIKVSTANGPVRCTTAFDWLHAAANRHTLSEVARLTWIPEEEIRAAARMIGAARSVAYYTWTGLGQHAQSTQIDRALATLMSLKGCYDAPGGNVVLPSVPRNAVCGPDLLDPAQQAKAIGLDDKPLGPPNQGRITAHDFYTAALDERPYKVRGLIGFGANLAVAHANSTRGRAALDALEFYVHCDVFENPSARSADFLLPVNTPWERDALRIGFGSGLAAQEHVQLRQQVVASAGESRSDAEIAFALADELGLRDQFFDGSIEAARSHILQPSGITLDQLRNCPEGVRYPLKQRYRKYAEPTEMGVTGFATETGQVELYSALLRRNGQPPVPTFNPDELPANETYPFALTTAKTGYYCHSQHRQVPSLRKREPEPTVNLAPEAAERLGLEAGDWAEISTRHGQVRMKVKLDNSLDQRVVRASFGWWQGNAALDLPGYDAFSKSGANYNMLVGSDQLDPVSGAAAHRSQSCNIIPIGPRRTVWHGFHTMRVTGLDKIAEGVTAVTLERPDGSVLPDFEPGQHIVLRWREAGEDLIRCYSLTGPASDSERTAYTIAVRMVGRPTGRDDVAPGRMSTAISSILARGDMLDVRAPSGRFTLPLVSERPVVLVAGGIGITPFLSYLETLARRPLRPRVHLAYANSLAETEAFSDRLASLAAAMPELTIDRCWSRAGKDVPADIHRGRLGISHLRLGTFEVSPAIYFCGPSGMVASLKAELVSAGHPDQLMFEEAFAAGSVDQTALPEGPYSVTFVRSGKTAIWDRARGSLLELAEAEGVRITNGCRAGQCESCEVRVLEGEITYRTDLVRSATDPCLACQAVPKSDLLVDV